jgi:hypothetical protein
VQQQLSGSLTKELRRPQILDHDGPLQPIGLPRRRAIQRENEIGRQRCLAWRNLLRE